MALKDLKNNLTCTKSINPQTLTATGNGTGVDLQGVRSALVLFSHGANSSGTFTPKVQESDDNSAWTDVAAADLEGTLANVTANEVQKVGYKGSKRYIRPSITTVSSPASLIASASVITEPLAKPAA